VQEERVAELDYLVAEFWYVLIYFKIVFCQFLNAELLFLFRP
jgi:hypothetical protein